MNRFCRWGMHRPGSHKIFNHGRNFTLCADCGESLVARRSGWGEAPAGKRIVWKRRSATDLFPRVSHNVDRRRMRAPLLRILLRGLRPARDR